MIRLGKMINGRIALTGPDGRHAGSIRREVFDGRVGSYYVLVSINGRIYEDRFSVCAHESARATLNACKEFVRQVGKHA